VSSYACNRERTLAKENYEERLETRNRIMRRDKGVSREGIEGKIKTRWRRKWKERKRMEEKQNERKKRLSRKGRNGRRKKRRWTRN
jgi:hypothetical protein